MLLILFSVILKMSAKSRQIIKLSEDIYRRIVETADQGIWISDPYGRTLYVNQKMAEMLGYTREELIGRQGLDFLEVGQSDTLLKEACGMEDVTSIAREYKLRRKDGSAIWTLVNASPLFDEQGRYIGNLSLHTDITERKRLEEALTRLKAELELRVQERTRELEEIREKLLLYTREIIRVQEEERKRIALELHDETAQSLALMTLELDSLLDGKFKLSEDVRSRLKRLRDEAERAQKEVRRFSHELRPAVLDNLGLEAALETLISDLNTSGSLNAVLEIKGTARRLPPDIELSLFRITQEAINNCRKHAQADSVIIKLHYEQNRVRLDIIDNGRGFDIRTGPARAFRTGHLGLISMQERARLVGGNVHIHSRPGTGTTVNVEVPV